MDERPVLIIPGLSVTLPKVDLSAVPLTVGMCERYRPTAVVSGVGVTICGGAARPTEGRLQQNYDTI